MLNFENKKIEQILQTHSETLETELVDKLKYEEEISLLLAEFSIANGFVNEKNFLIINKYTQTLLKEKLELGKHREVLERLFEFYFNKNSVVFSETCFPNGQSDFEHFTTKQTLINKFFKNIIGTSLKLDSSCLQLVLHKFDEIDEKVTSFELEGEETNHTDYYYLCIAVSECILHAITIYIQNLDLPRSVKKLQQKEKLMVEQMNYILKKINTRLNEGQRVLFSYIVSKEENFLYITYLQKLINILTYHFELYSRPVTVTDILIDLFRTINTTMSNTRHRWMAINYKNILYKLKQKLVLDSNLIKELVNFIKSGLLEFNQLTLILMLTISEQPLYDKILKEITLGLYVDILFIDYFNKASTTLSILNYKSYLENNTDILVDSCCISPANVESLLQDSYRKSLIKESDYKIHGINTLKIVVNTIEMLINNKENFKILEIFISFLLYNISYVYDYISNTNNITKTSVLKTEDKLRISISVLNISKTALIYICKNIDEKAQSYIIFKVMEHLILHLRSLKEITMQAENTTDCYFTTLHLLLQIIENLEGIKEKIYKEINTIVNLVDVLNPPQLNFLFNNIIPIIQSKISASDNTNIYREISTNLNLLVSKMFISSSLELRQKATYIYMAILEAHNVDIVSWDKVYFNSLIILKQNSTISTPFKPLLYAFIRKLLEVNENYKTDFANKTEINLSRLLNMDKETFPISLQRVFVDNNQEEPVLSGLMYLHVLDNELIEKLVERICNFDFTKFFVQKGSQRNFILNLFLVLISISSKHDDWKDTNKKLGVLFVKNLYSHGKSISIDSSCLTFETPYILRFLFQQAGYLLSKLYSEPNMYTNTKSLELILNNVIAINYTIKLAEICVPVQNNVNDSSIFDVYWSSLNSDILNVFYRTINFITNDINKLASIIPKNKLPATPIVKQLIQLCLAVLERYKNNYKYLVGYLLFDMDKAKAVLASLIKLVVFYIDKKEFNDAIIVLSFIKSFIKVFKHDIKMFNDIKKIVDNFVFDVFEQYPLPIGAIAKALFLLYIYKKKAVDFCGDKFVVYVLENICKPLSFNRDCERKYFIDVYTDIYLGIDSELTFDKESRSFKKLAGVGFENRSILLQTIIEKITKKFESANSLFKDVLNKIKSRKGFNINSENMVLDVEIHFITSYINVIYCMAKTLFPFLLRFDLEFMSAFKGVNLLTRLYKLSMLITKTFLMNTSSGGQNNPNSTVNSSTLGNVGALQMPETVAWEFMSFVYNDITSIALQFIKSIQNKTTMANLEHKKIIVEKEKKQMPFLSFVMEEFIRVFYKTAISSGRQNIRHYESKSVNRDFCIKKEHLEDSNSNVFGKKKKKKKSKTSSGRSVEETTTGTEPESSKIYGLGN